MKNYMNDLVNYAPGHNQIKIQYTDDQDKDKKHFVLWSGGCDSTLLLYELLETYGCENVVAVSYKYPWLHETKYETEKLHRDAFKSKIKLRGSKFSNFTHNEFDIKQNVISGDYMQVVHGGNGQAIAWMLSLPMIVPSGSFVYTGIVAEDLPLAMHEYGEAFSNISKVLARDITLRLPYLHFTKPQIIEKLFQYDIYEESWFCEMPKDINIPCGGCDPCTTHISALAALEITTKDELTKLKVQKELDKIRNRISDKKSDYVTNTSVKLKH